MKTSINLLFCGIIVLSLIGCGHKMCETKVRTEYVEVPAACKVTLPKQPILQGFKSGTNPNVVLDNVMSLAMYADKLEMALYCCTGDSRCIVDQVNQNE